jgi:hypothetical protein
MAPGKLLMYDWLTPAAASTVTPPPIVFFLFVRGFLPFFGTFLGFSFLPLLKQFLHTAPGDSFH